MINKWQAAYEVIRYTKYVFSKYDNVSDSIWLKNQKNKSLMILSDRRLQDGDIEETTDRIFKNKSKIENALDFKISKVVVYYFGELTFKRKFKSKTLKVNLLGIDNIEKIIMNPFYKIDTKYKKEKTGEWYKRRVLSRNPLETYLIKSTPMTSILIMINTLVFLLNLFYITFSHSRHLTTDLGLTHFGVMNGEYYRLISSAFLHENVDHFLFNIVALYVLGKFVEAIYSSGHVLVTYILTAIIANLTSLMFITDTLSLGASGATYGLMGVLLVYLIIYKKVQKKLLIQIGLIFIVIAILSNFFSNINHYAHFGGLIYGIILGGIYNYKRLSWKLVTLLFFISIIIPIIAWTIMQTHDSYQPYDAQALHHLQEGDYDKSLEKVNETFRYNNETSTSYYILARLYEVSENTDLAEQYYEKSFQINPKNELALKHKLHELRKDQNYEEMATLSANIDRDQVNDEELQLLFEELSYKGY